MIPTITLGRGGIQASQLSFGAAGIGNLFREISDEDAHEALRTYFDAGVNYFDTAPHYGLGLSERRVGEFISEVGRDNVVISTKVGRLIRPNPHADGGLDDQGFSVSNDLYRELDYSRDGVLRSVEESLERLGIDRIDIVFVHDPDDFETEALEGAFPALEELRSQGMITSYGSGMNQSAMLARFAQHTDLDVVMLAGRFSLLEQPALDDLLPVALEREVSIVAAGVFNSGILATNDPQPGAHYNYEPAPDAVVAKAQALAKECSDAGYSLPQVAAQFPLLHPAFKVICLGARSGEQAERNVKLMDAPVDPAFYQQLADKGLLRPEALAY